MSCHLRRLSLGGSTIAALFSILMAPARAEGFEVYCVPSADGVSTCSGWSDGGTLTCVSSSGGVASCKSTTGRQFTCVQDGSGVTTCQNPNKPTGRAGKGDACTYTGNGSFTCGRQPRNSADLIPSPNVINEPLTVPDSDVDMNIPSLIP